VIVTSIIDRALRHTRIVRSARTGVESADGGRDKASHERAGPCIKDTPTTGAKITTIPGVPISSRASTSRCNRAREAVLGRMLDMTVLGAVDALRLPRRENPAHWLAGRHVSRRTAPRRAGCLYAISSRQAARDDPMGEGAAARRALASVLIAQDRLADHGGHGLVGAGLRSNAWLERAISVVCPYGSRICSAPVGPDSQSGDAPGRRPGRLSGDATATTIAPSAIQRNAQVVKGEPPTTRSDSCKTFWCCTEEEARRGRRVH
jgi:hypothetical protein